MKKYILLLLTFITLGGRLSSQCSKTTARWRKPYVFRDLFGGFETEFGAIKMKIARADGGRLVNYAPEFEDCRLAAGLHQIPIREVQLAALRAFAEK